MYTVNSLNVSPKRAITNKRELWHLETSDKNINPIDIRLQDSPLKAAPTVDSAQLCKIGDNLGKLASLLCLSDEEDDDSDAARNTSHIRGQADNSSLEKKFDEKPNQEWK